MILGARQVLGGALRDFGNPHLSGMGPRWQQRIAPCAGTPAIALPHTGYLRGGLCVGVVALALVVAKAITG